MVRVMQWIVTAIGGLLGLTLANVVIEHPVIESYLPFHNDIVLYAIGVVLLALIFYFIYPLAVTLLTKVAIHLEKGLRSSNLVQISLQITGLIIGLILAALISSAFISFPVPGISWVISITIYFVFGYLGWTLPKHRVSEVSTLVNRFRRPRVIQVTEETPVEIVEEPVVTGQPKLLDTSVIIDGRIADIYKTKFIESSLVIPVYVLNELQLISDSSDDLKRTKGRRGLDIVAQLQDEFSDQIEILEEDYSELKDVDAKLIKTAKENNYKILTNDYNLNKLASVQGIEILNINDLANAVKIVVAPGEEITVSLLKAGKEAGQAIAYLDDGTMIVVEHGRHLIGQTLEVIVTSVLQTSAGRMIFAKPKGE